MAYIIQFTSSFTTGDKTPFSVDDYRVNGPTNPANPIPALNADSSVTNNTVRTSLLIYGKNMPNWGEKVEENLVQLLEHFCDVTPPVAPTKGQKWFDSSSGRFMFYDGTAWTSCDSVLASAITPTSVVSAVNPFGYVYDVLLRTGQLWFDTVNKQLMVYDGTSWVSAADQYVLKSGDTMTGFLNLEDGFSNPQVPSSNSNVVNKKYVDDSLTTHTNNLNIHLTSHQNTLLDNIESMYSTLTAMELGALDDFRTGDGSVQTQIDSKLSLTGSLSMTGNLNLNTHKIINSGLASNPDDLMSQEATDNRFLKKNGPSVSTSGLQDVLLNTSVTGATSTSYVPATTYTATINIDGINHAISFLGSVAASYTSLISTLSTQLSGFATVTLFGTYIRIQSLITGSTSSVSITDVTVFSSLPHFSSLDIAANGIDGNFMTGNLDINNQRLINLGSATSGTDGINRDYADARYLQLAGGIMTGTLRGISFFPSFNDEAASKKYVDDQVAGGSISASLVTFTPYGNISSINVQQAIQELDDECLHLSGGTMTGNLIINAVNINVTNNGRIDLPTPSGGFTNTTDVVNKNYVDSAAVTTITRSIEVSPGYVAANLGVAPTYKVGTNTLWIFVNGVKFIAGYGYDEAALPVNSLATSFTWQDTVPSGAIIEYLVF